MRFVVKFRSGDSPTTNRYPHAVLVQDNWDDYSYKTTSGNMRPSDQKSDKPRATKTGHIFGSRHTL
jgi:hypothetical protein